jgi:hypothetical protein
MFGETDAEDMSSNTTQFYGPGLLADAQQMVAEAKAANIQVVFGLEPGALPQLKLLLTMYGAFANIPVINYSDALGGAAFNGNGSSVSPNPYLTPDPTNSYFSVPNPAGQALMTQLAAAVISTMNLKLTGGYLQDTTDFVYGPQTNVNLLSLFQVVQFTPYGQYTGGVVVPISNTNYLTGTNGTWASSNPLVAQVNQQGRVWALTVGKTNITYTSPTGVKFSEWTLTVESYGNQDGPSTL